MNIPLGFRIRHTLTAFLVVVVAYLVYDMTVVRILTPPTVEAMPLKMVAALRKTASLSDLFPADAWQNGSCKRFQTPNAMLLFENWEQRGNDAWKVWPVTIIFGRGMSSDASGPPIVLESAEGAEIEFADSLDLFGGDAPPIKRGRLIGDVVATRMDADHTTEPGAADRSFRLETTNIVIDQKRLYTTSPIQMQLGRASMRGRDLTLHLSGGGSDRKVVPDRMELIYLDEIQLPIDSEIPNEHVKIGCDGSVEYDFAISTLSMQDKVRIERTGQTPLGQTFTDQFLADDLRLTLNQLGSKTERKELSDWIASITATGDPVSINLPSMNSSVRADTLMWNVTRGQFQASGRRGIEIRRDEMTARLTNIDYRYLPSHPKSLGTIVSRGAGIVNFASDQSMLKSWRWREALEVRPENKLNPSDDLPPDALSIFVTGGCDFQTRDGGGGRADKVTGRLTRGSDDSFAPQRLDIAGNVSIDHARVGVRTDRMQVFFREGPNSKGQDSNRTSSPTTPVRSGLVVSQPTPSSAMGASSTNMTEPQGPPPMLSGDLIAIELTSNGKTYEPSRLSIDGHLTLSTFVSTANGDLPTQLSGRRMQWDGGLGTDVLQLVGWQDKPARLEIGDGFLIGPEIQVRRLDNLIWMKEAGEFRLPSAIARGGEDSTMLWNRPPHCRWQGEMLFDGANITIDGGVDLDGQLQNGDQTQNVRLTGEAISAEFSAPIDLMKLQVDSTISAKEMILSGTPQRLVFAETRVVRRDSIETSRHQFHAEQLRIQSSDVDGEMNALVGQGPGWYRGWMSSKGKPGGRIGGGNDAAVDDSFGGLISSDHGDGNGRPSDGSGSIIRGVHLAFRDSMVGRLDRREVTFDGGVRVAMKDVANFDESFDGMTVTTPPPGLSVVDCNTLRLAMIENGSRGGDPLFEIQGDGAVRFQTHIKDALLTGDAAMATYSSRNDLFVVRGLPNSPARVQSTRTDGQPGANTLIKILAIHPREMVIEQFVPLSISMPIPQTASRQR